MPSARVVLRIDFPYRPATCDSAFAESESVTGMAGAVSCPTASTSSAFPSSAAPYEGGAEPRGRSWSVPALTKDGITRALKRLPVPARRPSLYALTASLRSCERHRGMTELCLQRRERSISACHKGHDAPFSSRRGRRPRGRAPRARGRPMRTLANRLLARSWGTPMAQLREETFPAVRVALIDIRGLR